MHDGNSRLQVANESGKLLRTGSRFVSPQGESIGEVIFSFLFSAPEVTASKRQQKGGARPVFQLGSMDSRAATHDFFLLVQQASMAREELPVSSVGTNRIESASPGDGAAYPFVRIRSVDKVIDPKEVSR